METPQENWFCCVRGGHPKRKSAEGHLLPRCLLFILALRHTRLSQYQVLSPPPKKKKKRENHHIPAKVNISTQLAAHPGSRVQEDWTCRASLRREISSCNDFLEACSSSNSSRSDACCSSNSARLRMQQSKAESVRRWVTQCNLIQHR